MVETQRGTGAIVFVESLVSSSLRPDQFCYLDPCFEWLLASPGALACCSAPLGQFVAGVEWQGRQQPSPSPSPLLGDEASGALRLGTDSERVGLLRGPSHSQQLFPALWLSWRLQASLPHSPCHPALPILCLHKAFGAWT